MINNVAAQTKIFLEENRVENKRNMKMPLKRKNKRRKNCVRDDDDVMPYIVHMECACAISLNEKNGEVAIQHTRYSYTFKAVSNTNENSWRLCEEE